MRLKQLIAAAAIAFASVSASAVAIVLNPLDVNLTTTNGSLYTGGFHSTVAVTGDFSQIINFHPNLRGAASGSVITIALDLNPGVVDPLSVLNFTKVSLNGNAFSLKAGTDESWTLTGVSVMSPLVLTIEGNSGGNSSYGGTLNIRAVPEPGTLALLGLAGLGLGFSRRRKETKA